MNEWIDANKQIPMLEKSDDEYDDVANVTYHFIDSDPVLVCTKDHEITIGFAGRATTEKNKISHEENVRWFENNEARPIDVIAWMPLPKPYTKGANE